MRSEFSTTMLIKSSFILILIAFISTTTKCIAQNGLVTTKRTAPFGFVSFGVGATFNNAGNTRYIDGYVKSYMSTKFVFPVGDNGFYRPFAASAAGVVGAYFAADPSIAITSSTNDLDYPALPSGAPFPRSIKTSEVREVSSKEYWDVNGSAQTKITLTWNSSSNLAGLVNGSLSNLCIVGWQNNIWVRIPADVDITSLLGGNSSITSGSITTKNAIIPDAYTVYTLGAVSSSLPVTLVDFDAYTAEQNVLLKWSVSAEINSKVFEIEHSGNGKEWNNIGAVESKGGGIGLQNYSFLHKEPFHGKNYYRLKMVDMDETYAYSKISNLDFVSSDNLVVYPNPVSDRLYFKFSEASQIKDVSILDHSGRIVFSQASIPDEGLDVRKFNVGIYILIIKDFYGKIKTYRLMVNR